MRRKPEYYSHLYLGESMNADKLDKIKKKLEKKPLISGVFLITLSKNPKDQLEIYDARQLVQTYYKKNPPYIVGIAADYEEAITLVEHIVRECVETRGDCSLKEYLLC